MLMQLYILQHYFSVIIDLKDIHIGSLSYFDYNVQCIRETRRKNLGSSNVTLETINLFEAIYDKKSGHTALQFAKFEEAMRIGKMNNLVANFVT